MAATNKVIKGDFEGYSVVSTLGIITFTQFFSTKLILKKEIISSYEIIDEEKQKSLSSALGRAAVRGILLGPLGLLAGVTAKSKGTYLIAIEFVDGKKSLIEADDKINKSFSKMMF